MDLSQQPPRRWSDTLAGMMWLPRLIDKVRAFQADTLGTYAYPSALDQSFMRRFQLTPAYIEPLVRDAASDEAIGTAIRARIQLSDEEVQHGAARSSGTSTGWHSPCWTGMTAMSVGWGIRSPAFCSHRSGDGINAGRHRRPLPRLSDALPSFHNIGPSPANPQARRIGMHRSTSPSPCC
jgi:hypothetical protein